MGKIVQLRDGQTGAYTEDEIEAMRQAKARGDRYWKRWAWRMALGARLPGQAERTAFREAMVAGRAGRDIPPTFGPVRASTVAGYRVGVRLQAAGPLIHTIDGNPRPW